MQKAAPNAFVKALEEHNLTTTISYKIHEASLSALDPALKFDLVVSPANSFGLLDGSFDDAISRAWSPKDDYSALLRALQRDLYEKYRGFQTPGTCHLFKMPEEFKGKLRYNDGKGWGCRFIAHCPTMRSPSSCDWDREVVYECIWNLLCTIDNHNRAVARAINQASDARTKNEIAGDTIRSILMTPLGTGVGGISLDKWANQTALAIRHYSDAVNDPKVWSRLDWPQVLELTNSVQKYH